MVTSLKIKDIYNNKVHFILMHSYFFYFLFLILAIIFDFIFNIKIFNNFFFLPIGFILLFLSSFLILWAQKTSHDFRKIKEKKVEHFCRGPYCYTRNPTHFGLFFLILAFGIIANAFFVVLFTVISFLISKFIFLNQQEKILIDKYGSTYIEYKKLVKF